jgi:hypothetical protein
MKARTRNRIAVLALIAAVLVVSLPVCAQVQVASVVSAMGTVEVQRSGKGEWQPAQFGNALFTGDAVRTGAGAGAKLLFSDDAVVDLGPSTALSIEHYAGGKGGQRSLLHLNQGKVEAWVSGYGSEDARYEVETPTAVARVQSTDFVVSYDPTQKATDVVSVEGTVAVRGTTGIIGPGVAVGPNETTHVPRDGFPSPAKSLDPAQLGEVTRGLRLVGTGAREGLETGNPIAEGRIVAANDRPTAATAAAAPAETGEAFLKPGVPGQTLLYTLSPDARANNQPLPDYRAVPPNRSPNPPH